MQRYMNPKFHNNDVAYYTQLYIYDPQFAME